MASLQSSDAKASQIGFEDPKASYTPLSGQQIRLLRLDSPNQSPPDREIRLLVGIYDLATKPNYRALSYTWGDQSEIRHIYVNGKRFVVRQNLFDFLGQRSFEQKVETARELLWIDQICIDQNSTMERNHQVQLMSEIYRQASQVLVWLGRDDSAGEWMSRSTAAHMRSIGLDSGHPKRASSHPRLCAAFEELLSKSYWNRMWIAQELIVAKGIVLLWGKERTEWADFCNLIERIRPPSSNIRFLVLKALDAQPHHPLDFVSLVESASCNERRDLCYGIQGLLDERYNVDIDYGKSIQQVWIDLAVAVLKQRTKDGAIFDGLRRFAYAMGLCPYHGELRERLRMVQLHCWGDCHHFNAKAAQHECTLSDRLPGWSLARSCCKWPGWSDQTCQYMLEQALEKPDRTHHSPQILRDFDFKRLGLSVRISSTGMLKCVYGTSGLYDGLSLGTSNHLTRQKKNRKPSQEKLKVHE